MGEHMDSLADYCRSLREWAGATDIPVDVFFIARKLGLKIVWRSWKGEPHAISVTEAGIVILNSRRDLYAQRFDLAHEVGEKNYPPLPPHLSSTKWGERRKVTSSVWRGNNGGFPCRRIG